MDFHDVINNRQSIRAFESRPVDEESLDAILQCVGRAPSAGDLQAYEVIVVTKPQTRRALADAALDQGFIADAPVVLAFFQAPDRSARKYEERGASMYALQDATVACAHAQLAATALGLGTCWVGAFDDDAVSAAVNAPTDVTPIALLPIGHPAETPEPTPRRPMSRVKRESF